MHSCSAASADLSRALFAGRDYPYHPGTGRLGGYQESYGKFPSEIPFGLQFNTCITDFTPENVQKAAPFVSSSEASEAALLRRGARASSWARVT